MSYLSKLLPDETNRAMWKTELLGRIADTTSGGTPDKKHPEYYKNGNILWVRSGELDKGIIYDTEIKITETGLQNSSAKVFPAGTLLIALYGATIGKLAFLGKPASTNQAVCAIFQNDTVSLRYLYYYLLFFRPELIKQGIGGAQPNISQTILKKLPVHYPASLDEQERIVARIEELFSQLDSGVETLRKTKQQLAVYRQAVLKEAFAGFTDYTTLASISTRIFDGPFGTNLKTADYVSSGIRVVRLENIKNGWFDDSKQSFVTEEKYESIKQHTVYPSDLIMSTFMADNIKICQLPAHIPFAVNKADCIGIRLRDDFLPKFVMLFLLQREVYQRVAVDIHGATRPRVNTKQIKAIPIPKAGFELQNAIVSSVEEKLSLCDSIENTVDMSLHQAEAMRQSILKQAFEGDI